MPKVSVIIPVYKVGEYIHKSLDSLVNQTLKDIEFIFVDDCSIDNSIEIVKEYQKNDDRIKIIYNKVNSGSGISRNNGIEIATGEYLAFFDPDDWGDLNFYEKLYNKAKEKDYDIAKTNRYLILDGEPKLENKINLEIGKRFENNKEIWEVFTFQHTTAIYKTNLVKQCNARYGTTRRDQDTTFLLRVCYYAKNIALVEDETYYYYYKRSDSMTGHKDVSYYRDIIDSVKDKIIFLNSIYDEIGVQKYNNAINRYIKSRVKRYRLLEEDNSLKKYRAEIFNKIANLKNLVIDYNSPESKKIYSKDQMVNYLFYKSYNKYVFDNVKANIEPKLKKIFSVKNEKSKKNKWYKVIYILGIKLSFRNKRKEKRVAEEKERKELKATLKLLKNQNRELKAELKFQQKEWKNQNRELKNELKKQNRELKKEFRYNLHKYCVPEMRPVALKDWYFERTGEELDIDNPQTFNEKMQWLKLYDSTPIKTKLADKYLVRDWIKEKIGEEYLIPLLGVWDSFDEIDFDTLPNKFVLKCNHGCGYNIIVKDKSQLDIEDARKKINAWLHEDIAFYGFEMHYSDIPRKIIAEQYINPLLSNIEIQVWCFDGVIHAISYENCKDVSNACRCIFDSNWNIQNYKISPQKYSDFEQIPQKPIWLDELNHIVKILSKGFKHVRVDFIEYKGKLLFREMTFTSASGLSKFEPVEQSLILGNLIKLPIEEKNGKIL